MGDGRAPRVLVVEDHREVRRLLVRFLESKGCVVDAAPDGMRGFEVLRQREYDVVVSDVNMPGLGGVELRALAVAIRPALRGRLVFVSALPPPPALADQPCLLKPFGVLEFWRVVQGRIEGGVGEVRDISTGPAL